MSVDNDGENTVPACERTVDDRRNPGDCRKVRGITLGIRKYRLTRGFVFARVMNVPESARQPGANDRVAQHRSSERCGGVTSSVHEAQRVRTGQEATVLRGTAHRETGESGGEVPGRPRAGHPNCPARDPTGRRECDDAGNRVSVNGVEGLHEPGNRQPGAPLRQRSSLRRVTGSGVSGNGGRFAGRRGRGGTGIGQPMWRRRGNGPLRRRPGLDSGDGGRFADRRGRGGRSAGFARTARRTAAAEVRLGDGRKRASPAESLSREHDGRCVRS